MKSAIVAGLLTSVLYSQQAVATYSWNNAQSFSNPDNSNNNCTTDQSGGYNWGDVPTGPVRSFDGFDFSGFDCQDSFNVRNGKRGLIRRTRFSGKAIVGQATNDDVSCPKIKGQDKDFSIREMHVSVDKDADLTFEYDMPDGSTCRQRSRCSVDGTTVKNNQCGGAKQVKVKGDCGFGFHSIIFDCQPGTSSSSSSTTTTPVTTPSTTTTTTTTTSACAETESKNDKGSCVPKTTPVTTTPVTTTPPVTTTTTSTCAETESKNDKGSCVPKTPPVTTTPATTTTSVCAETESKNDKGSCVPKTTPVTTTPATTPATTTSACKETETLDKGSCVPKTPTGGVTTPTACATTETSINGKCVPLTTDVKPSAPTCGPSETLSGTGCVTTTPPPSSDLVTTEIVVTTLTTCPVTITSGTITSVTLTLSTTTITSTATFCPKCGEKPPSTIGSTTVDAPPPTTPVCKPEEELKEGKCVAKPPTGGSTTPVPTTTLAPCKENEERKDGQCVVKPPTTSSTSSVPTTTPAPPTCKDTEELKDGKCVSKTPTGGVTSPSTTVDATPPETPAPEVPCPSVLPRCLSTWMEMAGSCSSNSDIKCFCPSPDFISSVQDCVSAWSDNDEEVQGALSYLVGICAEFVPQNPGICTGVPSTITLVPTPSAPAQPAPPTGGAPSGGNGAPRPTPPPFAGEMPSTVITFTRTLTEGSTTTQFVTVPQVVFNTVTQQVTIPGNNGQPPRTADQGVGLVPALPLTTPAAPPAGPSDAPPSTPVAGQTFVPSTAVASQTNPNGPVKTFTGSADKFGYGIAAGVFGLIAFLA